jgi:hypothetical protein
VLGQRSLPVRAADVASEGWVCIDLPSDVGGNGTSLAEPAQGSSSLRTFAVPRLGGGGTVARPM